MSSKVFDWKSISLPESVIAGQFFIISVEVEAKEALYDYHNRVMLDSSDNVILPNGGEHKSKYTGEEIEEFIAEELKWMNTE